MQGSASEGAAPVDAEVYAGKLARTLAFFLLYVIANLAAPRRR